MRENSILNILGGFKLSIGIVLLAFGCLLDFSWFGIGTSIRFMSGLAGAYLIIGNAKAGLGYIVGMVVGMVGYAYAIQSGRLGILWFDGVYLEGYVKYALRMIYACMFILGIKDVKDG